MFCKKSQKSSLFSKAAKIHHLKILHLDFLRQDVIPKSPEYRLAQSASGIWHIFDPADMIRLHPCRMFVSRRHYRKRTSFRNLQKPNRFFGHPGRNMAFIWTTISPSRMHLRLTA